MKKKLLAIGLSLAMVFAVTACGGSGSGNSSSSSASDASASAAAEQVSGELYVSAAASMTESLDKVIEKFEKQNPDCKVTPTYDSSGTLETQIIEGSPCDVFISAAQKQMNELDGENEACLGDNYVLKGSRVDLLENTAVLVVSDDNKDEIKSWDDFVKKLESAQSSEDLIFCMGNSDVPVGAYTSKILQALGVDEARFRARAWLLTEPTLKKSLPRYPAALLTAESSTAQMLSPPAWIQSLLQTLHSPVRSSTLQQ
jgi:molybdate transport system substrate-binding protein